MSKICIARVDRIGDLILTLPCQTVWQTSRPEDKIIWLVNENLKFVMTQVSPSVNALYVTTPRGFIARVINGLKLLRQLREENIDEVIAVHVPWWIAFAFYFAGIKRRTGVASQWYSWIFFNRRLRQKRSQAVKHESQYNLDLIKFALGNSDTQVLPATILHPLEKYVQKWTEKFISSGLDLKRMVVIHPGMAGSARNWPAIRYRELTAMFLAQKVSVVVTGGLVDKVFLKQTDIENLRGVYSVVGKTDGHDLLAILSLARCVVAPSTGVAHLAASVGVPVAGIYSPVKVQAPIRWAPRGRQVEIFVPQVNCPGVRACLGPVCKYYDCMSEIPVDSVATYVMDKL
ncbi:MAG: glycosyltransferase family 9 protein [Oligoflexia bacterium]|nr:glycosyltransferase family 9 protein [Oligoflexia bacterium]